MNRGDDGNIGEAGPEGVGTIQLLNQPKAVLRRVKALKKLQVEEIGVESEFHKRLNQLEKEFEPLFQKINQKRKTIVAGEYEPTEDECDAPLFHGMPAEDMEKIEKMVPKEIADVKGVPDFWLDVMLNCYEVEELIQGDDVEILKYLADITSDLHENDPGFTLSFHFAENPFFSNRVLKKAYVLSVTPDTEMPLDYDGPVLRSSKADAIEWVRGGPTAGGGKRNIRGEVVRPAGGLPSFFDAFDGTEKAYTDELGEDEEAEMERDFEIAMLFRDSIIPKAVLYLTDEMPQTDDLDSYEDEDEDDDDEEGDGSSNEDENMEG